MIDIDLIEWKSERNRSDRGRGDYSLSQAVGVKVDRLDAIRSHLYANGFSTIQALADAIGASLSVQSGPGQGSTFAVTLPPSAVIERPSQSAHGGQA